MTLIYAATAYRGYRWNPESRMLECNLSYLRPHHRYGHTFSRYFVINIKSIITPSLSFIEADLAKRQLLIGVLDGTLKAGCSNSIEDISVHIIDMDLLFEFTSLVTLNQS